MFCALLPFAIFNADNPSMSWSIISTVLCIYSVIGLLIFPRRVIGLRKKGYQDLFPIRIVAIQQGILAINFILSGMMVVDVLSQKNNIYLFCLILFLVQSTIAFIRTMFFRVK
jgi:hypothetical protein